MPLSSKPCSWAGLIQAQLMQRDKRPTGKGWKTSSQLCEQFNFGRGKLQMMLKQMIEDGTVEMFCGSETQKPGGIAYQQRWYRTKVPSRSR
jgi:hypothetical protein